MKYDIISVRSSRTPYKVSSPSDIFAVLRRYASARSERFIVLTLDGAHQVIRANIISIGLVNRTVVHPREVFYPAIVQNACAIVVSHNHPSGRLDPSPEDRDITDRLRQASEVLGIALLDHVIIGRTGFYSFVEHGLLSAPSTD
jgi:DNA repair protein RadC